MTFVSKRESPYGHTNFPMKSVKSRQSNELIQMDHLKVSRTERGKHAHRGDD